MNEKNSEIAENIGKIQERIAQAAQRAGRTPDEVRLVAVTKTHPHESVLAVGEAGVFDIGENRVQEALEKIDRVGEPSIGAKFRWHLIGQLQSNKARGATGRFDLIHSLTSQRLADAINRSASDQSLTQPVLIQMNISEEDSKSGLYTLLDACKLTEHVLERCSNVRIEGLMTIAAPTLNPEEARGTFTKLREIRDGLRARFPEMGWRHLSMGMTGDLEVAVEEGATLVRVGSAIFGGRGLG